MATDEFRKLIEKVARDSPTLGNPVFIGYERQSRYCPVDRPGNETMG
jgi:hypothetical protein